MYIETSQLYGDVGFVARLVSPNYTPPAGEQCLEFWYHMYGTKIGTLNVYFQSGGFRDYPKFSKTGKRVSFLNSTRL